MCKVPDVLVAVCCSIWGLCSWVYVPLVRNLSSLCVKDYEVSDLLGCLFPRMRDFWLDCGNVLTACKFSDLFEYVCPGYEVSALFVDICPRVWGLWSICHFMSQNVRSLSLGVCQGYELSDTFVLVCLRQWGLWSVFLQGRRACIIWVLKFICSDMT